MTKAKFKNRLCIWRNAHLFAIRLSVTGRLFTDKRPVNTLALNLGLNHTISMLHTEAATQWRPVLIRNAQNKDGYW